eukprot:COSAG05_NODE_3449_length_2055_cov_1.139059_2_plen_80_part_00
MGSNAGGGGGGSGSGGGECARHIDPCQNQRNPSLCWLNIRTVAAAAASAAAVAAVALAGGSGSTSKNTPSWQYLPKFQF